MGAGGFYTPGAMAYDAAVVGGGLVGAACAYRLASEGCRVALFEARRFLREASWAAAGLLTPLHPAQYPAALHPLLREGPAEHERLARELAERFGAEVQLWTSGMVVVGEDARALETWYGPGSARAVEASREEPLLRRPTPATLFPGVRQVRNDLLGQALLDAARALGADLFEFAPVERLVPGGVVVGGRTHAARATVLCAGPWSGRLRAGVRLEPVRGQILLYRAEGRRIVVFADGSYSVPRRGGLLLFGSTLERAGFDGRPTREACEGLERRAEELLGLRRRALLAAWAGLRPATPNLLPCLGRDPGRPDLILACGHYRNGVLLAPGTARIVTDLVAGRRPPYDLAPFAPPPWSDDLSYA